MKKSIGLTADLSTFNTTLPQTRHLNYFMNTNPQRFAKGGDVNQGIPNYPNPNVTSGFLPMALGFAPGGEVKEKDTVTKVYDFVFGYFKNVLGMDDDEAKEKTEETINNSTEEEIQDIVQKIPSGPSQEVFDREEEIKGLETPRKPLTPIDTVTPTEPITTRSDRQGAFDNVPMQPLPKISTEQQQREFQDSQKPMGPIPQMTPPNDGGITTIDPEKSEPKSTNPFDVNGDGMVTFADLAEAIRLGMGTKFIQELRQFLEGFKGEEKPDRVEVPEQDGPVDTIPSPVDPKPKEELPKIKEDNKKIKPKLKIKPPRDNDGIAGVPPKGAVDVTGKQTLTKEDQDTLKKGADLASGGDGGIKNAKNKKDVPSWALPMMSAGFAMMASKSPYFMQALGEAGQAGVETYSAQKTAEEDKLDKEATREQSKAMAAYYRGEGRQGAGTMKIINGVYHKLNPQTNEFDPMTLKGGAPAKVTISRQDAIDYLMTNDPNFAMGTYEYKQEAIQKHMDIYNETNNQIIEKNKEEGGGFSIFDIPKKFGDFLEGFQNAKDGGIVSIRR